MKMSFGVLFALCAFTLSGCAGNLTSQTMPYTQSTTTDIHDARKAPKSQSAEVTSPNFVIDPGSGDPSGGNDSGDNQTFTVNGLTGFLIGGNVTGVCDPLTGQTIGSTGGFVVPCTTPTDFACTDCTWEPNQTASLPFYVNVTTPEAACAELGEEFDTIQQACFIGVPGSNYHIGFKFTAFVYNCGTISSYTYSISKQQYLLQCQAPSVNYPQGSDWEALGSFLGLFPGQAGAVGATFSIAGQVLLMPSAVTFQSRYTHFGLCFILEGTGGCRVNAGGYSIGLYYPNN